MKKVWLNIVLTIVFLVSNCSAYAYDGFWIRNEFHTNVGIWYHPERQICSLYLKKGAFFSFTNREINQIIETFLRLPSNFLWVNLSPGYPPLPRQLLGTAVGRTLLRMDLYFKRDLEHVLMKHIVYSEVTSIKDFPYFWIEPGRVYIGKDNNNKFFIRKAAIRVKVQTKDRKLRSFYSSICREMEQKIAISPTYKPLRDLFGLFLLVSYLKKHFLKVKNAKDNAKLIPGVEFISPAMYSPRFFFSPYSVKDDYLGLFYLPRNLFFRGKELIVALGGIKLKLPFAWVRTMNFPSGLRFMGDYRVICPTMSSFKVKDREIGKAIARFLKWFKPTYTRPFVLVNYGRYASDPKDWWAVLYNSKNKTMLMLSNTPFSFSSYGFVSLMVNHKRFGLKKFYYSLVTGKPLLLYLKKIRIRHPFSEKYKYKILSAIGRLVAKLWNRGEYIRLTIRDIIVFRKRRLMNVSYLNVGNLNYLPTEKARINSVIGLFDSLCKLLRLDPNRNFDVVNTFFSPILSMEEVDSYNLIRTVCKRYDVLVVPDYIYGSTNEFNINLGKWIKKLQRIFSDHWPRFLSGVFFMMFGLGGAPMLGAWFVNKSLVVGFLPLIINGIKNSANGSVSDDIIAKEKMVKLIEALLAEGGSTSAVLKRFVSNPGLFQEKLIELEPSLLEKSISYELWLNSLILPLLNEVEAKLNSSKGTDDFDKYVWFIYNALDSLNRFKLENYSVDEELFQSINRHTAMYTYMLPLLLKYMPENTDYLLNNYVKLLRVVLSFARELSEPAQEMNALFTLFNLSTELPQYDAQIKNKAGIVARILKACDLEYNLSNYSAGKSIYIETAWQIANSDSVKRLLELQKHNKSLYSGLTLCQYLLFSFLRDDVSFDRDITKKVLTFFNSKEIEKENAIVLLGDFLNKLYLFSSYSPNLNQKVDYFIKQLLAYKNNSKKLSPLVSNLIAKGGDLLPGCKAKILSVAFSNNYSLPDLANFDKKQISEILISSSIDFKRAFIKNLFNHGRFKDVIFYGAPFIDDNYILIYYLIASFREYRYRERFFNELTKFTNGKLNMIEKLSERCYSEGDLETSILASAVLAISRPNTIQLLMSRLIDLKGKTIRDTSTLVYLVEVLEYSLAKNMVSSSRDLQTLLKMLSSIRIKADKKSEFGFNYYKKLFYFCLDFGYSEFLPDLLNKMQRLAKKTNQNDLLIARRIYENKFVLPQVVYKNLSSSQKYIWLIYNLQAKLKAMPFKDSELEGIVKDINMLKDMRFSVTLDRNLKVMVDVLDAFARILRDKKGEMVDDWIGPLNWACQEICFRLFQNFSITQWFEARDRILEWFKQKVVEPKAKLFDHEMLEYFLLSMALAEARSGNKYEFWEIMDLLSSYDFLSNSLKRWIIFISTDYISSAKDLVRFESIMDSVNGWELLKNSLTDYLRNLKGIKKKSKREKVEQEHYSYLFQIIDRLVTVSKQTRLKVKTLIGSSVGQGLEDYPNLYRLWNRIERLNEQEDEAKARFGKLIELIANLTEGLSARLGVIPAEVEGLLESARLSYVNAGKTIDGAVRALLRLWDEGNPTFSGRLMIAFYDGKNKIDEFFIPSSFPLNLFSDYYRYFVAKNAGKFNKIVASYALKSKTRNLRGQVFGSENDFNKFWLITCLGLIKDYTPKDIALSLPTVEPINYVASLPENRISKRAKITQFLIKQGWLKLHGDKSVLISKKLIELANIEADLQNYLYSLLNKNSLSWISQHWDAKTDKLVVVPLKRGNHVLPVIVWIKAHPLGAKQYIPYAIFKRGHVERFNSFGEFDKNIEKESILVQGYNWPKFFKKTSNKKEIVNFLGKSVFLYFPYRIKFKNGVTVTYTNWSPDIEKGDFFVCPLVYGADGKKVLRLLVISAGRAKYILSGPITQLGAGKDDVMSLLFVPGWKSNASEDWWKQLKKVSRANKSALSNGANLWHIEFPRISFKLRVIIPFAYDLPWFKEMQYFDRERWIFVASSSKQDSHREHYSLDVYWVSNPERFAMLDENTEAELKEGLGVKYLFSINMNVKEEFNPNKHESVHVAKGYILNKETNERLEGREVVLKTTGGGISLRNLFPDYIYTKHVANVSDVYKFKLTGKNELSLWISNMRLIIPIQAEVEGKKLIDLVRKDLLQIRVLKRDFNAGLWQLRMELVKPTETNRRIVPLFDFQLQRDGNKVTVMVNRSYKWDIPKYSFGPFSVNSVWLGECFNFNITRHRYNQDKPTKNGLVYVSGLEISMRRVSAFWTSGLLELHERKVDKFEKEISLILKFANQDVELGKFLLKENKKVVELLLDDGQVITTDKSKRRFFPIYSLFPNLSRKLALRDISIPDKGKIRYSFPMDHNIDLRILIQHNLPLVDLKDESSFILWTNYDKRQVFLVLPQLGLVIPILRIKMEANKVRFYSPFLGDSEIADSKALKPNQLVNIQISLARLLGLDNLVKHPVMLDFSTVLSRSDKGLNKFLGIYKDAKKIKSVLLPSNMNILIINKARNEMSYKRYMVDIKFPSYLLPFLMTKNVSFNSRIIADNYLKVNLKISVSKVFSYVFSKNLVQNDISGALDLEELFPDIKLIFSKVSRVILPPRSRRWYFDLNLPKGLLRIFVPSDIDESLSKFILDNNLYLRYDKKYSKIYLFFFTKSGTCVSIPILKIEELPNKDVKLVSLLVPHKELIITRQKQKALIALFDLVPFGAAIESNPYLRPDEKEAYSILEQQIMDIKEEQLKEYNGIDLLSIFPQINRKNIYPFALGILSGVFWVAFGPLAGIIMVLSSSLFWVFHKQITNFLLLGESQYSFILERLGLSSDLANIIGNFLDSLAIAYPWARPKLEAILENSRNLKTFAYKLLDFLLGNMGRVGKRIATNIAVSDSSRIPEFLRTSLLGVKVKSKKFSPWRIYKLAKDSKILGLFFAYTGVGIDATSIISKGFNFNRDEGSVILFNLLVFNKAYWKKFFGRYQFAFESFEKLFAHHVSGKFLRMKLDYALYYLRELADLLPSKKDAIFSALYLYRSQFYRQPMLLRFKEKTHLPIRGGIVF